METKQYYSSVIPDFLVIYHDLPFPSQIRWATSLFSWSSHITNHHTTGWVHGGMWLSCCGGVWRRSAPFRRQLFARCVGQYGETNDVWGIRMGKSNGKTWQNQWENMGRLHLGNRLREYVFLLLWRRWSTFKYVCVARHLLCWALTQLNMFVFRAKAKKFAGFPLKQHDAAWRNSLLLDGWAFQIYTRDIHLLFHPFGDYILWSQFNTE